MGHHSALHLGAAFALPLGAGILLALHLPVQKVHAQSAPARNQELGTTPAVTEPSALGTQQGWRLLFDGETFNGWRGLGRPDVPEAHWMIEDGSIKKIDADDVPLLADGQPLQGGDLMTVETFGDFELSFEWKISPGGNSGVKYNVSEELSISIPPVHAALGFEYQVLDDDLHPDRELASHRAAALYDLIPAEGKPLAPVGEFNRSRIVLHGDHGEHWLNGVKVLEYDLTSERMAALLASSKYRGIGGFAERRRGHIVLQDHTDEVWFRNLKLRDLEP